MQVKPWVVIAGLLCFAELTPRSTLAEAPAGSAKSPKSPSTATNPILLRLTVASDADPTSGSAPLKVEFEAEVYEGDNAVKPVFTWNFGDRSPSARGPKVVHVYKKPGEYIAVVTVKSADGRGGTSQQDINVEAPE